MTINLGLADKAPLDAMLQVVLKGTYGAQQVRNVFWLAASSGVGSWVSSQGLAALQGIARHVLHNVIKDSLKLSLATSVSYQSAEAKSHEGGGTIWKPGMGGEYFETISCDRAGDALPTFCAMGFRMGPISVQLVRKGFKRFPGVSEGDTNGGLWALGSTTPLGVANFEEYTELKHSVTVADQNNAEYYVVIPTTQKQADGKYAVTGGYRVAQCELMGSVRSQYTRQRGIGA